MDQTNVHYIDVGGIIIREAKEDHVGVKNVVYCFVRDLVYNEIKDQIGI